MSSVKLVKAEARSAMKNSQVSVFLIAFVFVMISLGLYILDVGVTYAGVDLDSIAASTTPEELRAKMLAAAENGTTLGSIISLLLEMFSKVIGFGFLYACLLASRGIKYDAMIIFEGFSMFFKLVVLLVLQVIYIALWSMLLIVPGIIAAYRYSMSVYILFDTPELSPIEALRRSSDMMKGYKMRLFSQHLSFIPLGILCLIPFVVIFVMPYITTADAVFYNHIIGYVPCDDTVEEI